VREGCIVTLRNTLAWNTAYLGEREGAAASTVMRLECLRRDDPVVPTDVGEVHLQFMATTCRDPAPRTRRRLQLSVIFAPVFVLLVQKKTKKSTRKV
jgi:hypothetical protein